MKSIRNLKWPKNFWSGDPFYSVAYTLYNEITLKFKANDDDNTKLTIGTIAVDSGAKLNHLFYIFEVVFFCLFWEYMNSWK